MPRIAVEYYQEVAQRTFAIVAVVDGIDQAVGLVDAVASGRPPAVSLKILR